MGAPAGGRGGPAHGDQGEPEAAGRGQGGQRPQGPAPADHPRQLREQAGRGRPGGGQEPAQGPPAGGQARAGHHRGAQDAGPGRALRGQAPHAGPHGRAVRLEFYTWYRVMPLREYKCLVCGQNEERPEKWDDPPLPCCPYCGALAYRRVLQAPYFHLRGGWPGRLVGGERPFTGERVVQNRDGSETRYGSLQQAREGELERARAVLPKPEQGLARTLLARKNARALASGWLPGRRSTAYREAVEARAGAQR